MLGGLSENSAFDNYRCNFTAYRYNHQGQLTRLTNALGQNTLLSYGGANCTNCSGIDQLTSLIDAKNQQTHFTYDPIGRLVGETDPLNQTTAFHYGAFPSPDAISTPDGITIGYTYDALRRLIQKSVPNLGETTFAYDSRGNVIAAANPSVSYALTYDGANRIVSVNDSRGYVINYQYDQAGNRTSTVFQPGTPDERNIVVDYDDNRRPVTLSSSAGTFEFAYDLLDRRTTLVYPNGVATAYGYHPKGGLLTNIDTPQVDLTIDYLEHDKVGNRKQRSENGVTTSYSYDETYRLTSAVTGASAENFTYDAVGNRESGPTIKDTADVAYEHDAGNRMLKGRKFDYAYDVRGNQRYRYLSADRSKFWEYTWDGENRLRQAALTLGGQVVRTLNFKYDPFGRRIEKQVSDTASTVTTSYVYDGEDIVFTTVNDGTATTTSHYVHGPGIDEPLAQITNGTSTYYHADALGSIVALTDASKNVVQRYSYDAFGMVTAQNPEFANAYTFTGREWDRELGLYYYRARYYDPMEGRFISRDPIGFAGGDVNLYAYTGNDPANRLDPYGESSLTPFEKALRALAKALGYAEKADTALDTAELVGDSLAMTCAETPEERRQRQRDMVVDLINIGVATPPFVDAVDKNKRNAVDIIVDRMNETDAVYKELFPE
ncbi:RHS repeat-associated core domain-containing protein [Trichloromonas acetexigens]|uniref:RHS repeat-associated core domain-containing protein n=1 Tax=Trichloromonas acetexigens TaxID=38815 RepID=A0A550J6Y3_9BACT|nr:RHS repeat-associated core domain-containing protein [Desulfuromonas acetexigens]TRO78979.1 RHS repeat-associated core domain-containing protein [Desulfuromonas acetexigens]